MTEAVSRRAAALARRYRSSHSGIGTADYLMAATADYLMAATAEFYELPRLTRNVRHFPMVAGLRPPY